MHLRKHIIRVLPLLLMMVAGTPLAAQPESGVLKNIRDKFQKWISLEQWEEVYIHSDRMEYIAGENMWFNAYVIDRRTMKPSARSRIVYFELLNAGNRPVIQSRIFTGNGHGPGFASLPDTLSTGIYTIRAYTNHMKNFLPVNCFIGEIRVYNTMSPGSLKSKMIHRADSGKGIGNDQRDNRAAGDLSLKVSDRDKENLEITVMTGGNSMDNAGDLCYIFIQTHGITDYSGEVRITGQATVTAVPKSILTPGINQITLFDSAGRYMGEAYSYTPDREGAATAVISPLQAGTRSRITVEVIARREQGGNQDLSNLSISAVPASLEEPASLDDYLLFGSEFGDQHELIAGFRKAGTSPTMIDSLLHGLRSHWINWRNILTDSLPQIRYESEAEDHFLTGSLIDMKQNQRLAGKLVLMCIPGKEPDFRYAMTDARGNFSFRLHIDEEIKDMILMPDQEGDNLKIILGSSFAGSFPQSVLKPGPNSDNIPACLEDLSTNLQVRRIYGIVDTCGYMQALSKPLRKVRFYGKPDIELVMSDYVTLPKMEEVFFEILPHVSLKKKDKGYKVSVTDRIDNTRLEFSPYLFIDGVRIMDASIIAGTDPETVDKIDVVNGLYQIGSYTFTGIVNLTTKNADFSDIPLADYMTRISYRVTDPVPAFREPDYQAQGSQGGTIPDFRNTLYWSPNLKTGSGVTIWTSDIPGDYRVSVQGFDQHGNIVSASGILTVK